MAHLKKANAMVTHPRISGQGWGGIRRVASQGSTKNFTDQAREILGGPLDPDKYLFTHCTIVASVDTEVAAGAPLGKVKVGSSTVDRRYADYYINPKSAQYVNNNGDSWGRTVLLASYPTFIGGFNFLEHVQIEEQSKGRLLDAVARDLGDTVYVDLLVATERKHEQLIQRIECGELTTLSMGCVADFTLCSQCGNFAVDETQLCEHIKYSKLNTFLDDQGKKRVIAELCGHIDYKDNPANPAGVRFIEASWVGVPAFPGAVMRNILTTSDIKIPESEILKILTAHNPQNWSDQAIQKAASLSKKSFEFGGDEGEGENAEEAPAKAEAPKKPLQDLEDSLYGLLSDRVKKRFEKEMQEGESEKALGDSLAPNDSVIKEGHRQVTPRTILSKSTYDNSLKELVKVASNDLDLLAGLNRINESHGLKVASTLYKVALHVGSISRYSDKERFVAACTKTANRRLSPAEIRFLVRVGSTISLWEKTRNPV